MNMRVCCLLLVPALGLSACNLPRDPNGTAERVHHGLMRVGVSENPPWTAFQGQSPVGVEPDLVRRFAAEQHVNVQWVRGGETPLLKELEEYKLDLVVGGITADSPWGRKLATTRPYARTGKDKHIWLAPPGENRWVLTLDRFLQAHGPEAQNRVGGGA